MQYTCKCVLLPASLNDGCWRVHLKTDHTFTAIRIIAGWIGTKSIRRLTNKYNVRSGFRFNRVTFQMCYHLIFECVRVTMNALSNTARSVHIHATKIKRKLTYNDMWCVRWVMRKVIRMHGMRIKLWQPSYASMCSQMYVAESYTFFFNSKQSCIGTFFVICTHLAPRTHRTPIYLYAYYIVYIPPSTAKRKKNAFPSIFPYAFWYNNISLLSSLSLHTGRWVKFSPSPSPHTNSQHQHQTTHSTLSVSSYFHITYWWY